jgi:hypothetical protein
MCQLRRWQGRHEGTLGRRPRVRIDVRRRGPAVAGVAARDVTSPARGHARARERGAEAPPGFDGALRGSQVILGVGGEPEEAGEAATIGHANQRAGWAPTGACSHAFSAVGYLFLGATGELRAGLFRRASARLRSRRERLVCRDANPPRRPRPLGPVRVQHPAGRPRRAALRERRVRSRRRHLRHQPPAGPLRPLDPADDALDRDALAPHAGRRFRPPCCVSPRGVLECAGGHREFHRLHRRRDRRRRTSPSELPGSAALSAPRHIVGRPRHRRAE